MPDFGNAGKRTVHASEAACTVNASAGEFLIYTLDVRGATALFTFACSHHDVIVGPGGSPRSRYQWDGYDLPNSRDPDGDMHILMLEFSGGAIWYRFRMELFDGSFALKKVVKDVECETTDPEDVCFEQIGLRTI